MGTSAIPGLHTRLFYWDGSAYSRIGEVTNIGWDGPNREVIEISNLDTPDEYVERIQGVLDASNITATINYTGAAWAFLKNQMETRGKKFYRIELPDGFGIEWEGFISSVPLQIPTDAQMSGDVVLEISGKPDFLSGGDSTGAGASG